MENGCYSITLVLKNLYYYYYYYKYYDCSKDKKKQNHLVVCINIIIEFLTYQLWLGNIHLSWEIVINRIRLGGLICSLKSFLQLNMSQELQIFEFVYIYSGAS